MRKLILVLMAFLLVSCASPEAPEEEPDDTTVVGGGTDAYSILVPFANSPLRQEYTNTYRETDLMEIGRGLLEKSKEPFAPKNYSVSEGSLLTPDRYYELLGRESDTNVYALNKEGNFEPEEGVTLIRPQFVSNLVELNFHKTNSKDKVDAVSVAMVMKRIQLLDPEIGSTYRVEDDVLFEVGRTLGQQLHSYLRTLEGASDIPIMIALYVQESDGDNLPGRYLPGHYIGNALFESARSGEFTRTQESWVLMNSEQMLNTLPQTYSDFSEFKRTITHFMGDESVGVVGKAFMNGNKATRIQFEITTGPKTYLELHGLAESIKVGLKRFDDLGVDIVTDVMIFQKTRIIINKTAGQEAEIIILN